MGFFVPEPNGGFFSPTSFRYDYLNICVQQARRSRCSHHPCEMKTILLALSVLTVVIYQLTRTTF
jgi:hypothetical protein